MIGEFLRDRVIYTLAYRFRQLYEAMYFRKLRSKLRNRDFSLLSPNCYAGIIYHRLGLEYTSPTINLLFPIKKQYLKFISNLEYYLSKELVFIHDPAYSCPVAMLEDVKLVFNHYSTPEQAESAWNRRKGRINYSNLFIIFDDIADADYQDLIEFTRVKCAGKVILTAKYYPELPSAVQISKYKKSGIMKAYLLEKSIWTGKNPADKDFDFIKWLNSAAEN